MTGASWARRLLAPGIGALSIVLIECPAHASDEPAHPRWMYEAPAGCPSPAELESALRARVAATALESDPRTFVIQIARRGESFVGRLTFSNDIGERVVEERTCEEVVEALVVFTAIALDPSRLPPPQDDAPEPALPPPAAAVGAPAPSAPSGPPPRPETSIPPSRGRLPATLGFGAGAGVSSGPVPGPAPVLTIGAVLHQAFSRQRGVALRLGAKATRGEKGVSSGRLDAYLMAGHVDVAPTLTWRSFRLSAGPALELGVLSAAGQGLSATQRSNAFWADVGAVLRAGVGSGGLGFDVYASGAAALTPRTYMVQRPVGEREVHATPPLLFTIGAEIVMELGRGL